MNTWVARRGAESSPIALINTYRCGLEIHHRAQSTVGINQKLHVWQVLGVWSTSYIPKGTRFGPLVGQVYTKDSVPADANRKYFWRVRGTSPYTYVTRPSGYSTPWWTTRGAVNFSPKRHRSTWTQGRDDVTCARQKDRRKKEGRPAGRKETTGE